MIVRTRPRPLGEGHGPVTTRENSLADVLRARRWIKHATRGGNCDEDGGRASDVGPSLSLSRARSLVLEQGPTSAANKRLGRLFAGWRCEAGGEGEREQQATLVRMRECVRERERKCKVQWQLGLGKDMPLNREREMEGITHDDNS